MNNQILIDYIRQQLQLGANREQIRQVLSQKGWRIQDIESAFNSVDQSLLKDTQPSAMVGESRKRTKIIILVLVMITALGAGTYLANRLIFKSERSNSQQSSNQVPEVLEKQAVADNPEIIFADKLNSCTMHKISFKHPLTEETLEKEILGIVDGKCVYAEQMPNNGSMECEYSEGDRKVVAQYYKDTANAESFDTKAQLGSENQTVKYKIDGKEVDNPIQTALDKGTCVVKGY